MLKVVKFVEKQIIPTVSKYLPQSLYYHSGKSRYFTVEKPSRHFNKVIEVNISSDNMLAPGTPLYNVLRRYGITSLISLPELHNLSLVMRRYQASSN